jgi:hypothetical protein
MQGQAQQAEMSNNSPPTPHINKKKKYLRSGLRRVSIPTTRRKLLYALHPNKMSFEYLAMAAFITWCAKSPPIPWRWLLPNPLPDPPPYNNLISNVYYVSLAGLILTTAATHPAETFSLRYGPFMLVPAIQIVAGLYQNNAAVRATTTKAKM